MSLLSWFTRRAERAEKAPAKFPPLSDSGSVERSDGFEITITIYEPPPRRERTDEARPPNPFRTALDPIYVAMDYRDGRGEVTRRAITMLAMLTDHSPPLLVAKCHMRDAIRSFRTDRIQCFIDDQGEVLDPKQFLATISGLPARMFVDSPSPQPISIERPKPASAVVTAESLFREQLRSRVYLLVLAAKSDDEIHPRETDAILGFIEDEVSRLPGPTSLEVLEGFRPVVGRVRPRPGNVEEYLADVMAADGASQRRFWAALKRVIDADERLHPSEEEFWSDLNRLAGTG